MLYVGINQRRKQMTVSVQDESAMSYSGGRSVRSGRWSAHSSLPDGAGPKGSPGGAKGT